MTTKMTTTAARVAAVETAYTVSDKLTGDLRIGVWKMPGGRGRVQVQLWHQGGAFVVRDLTGLVTPQEALAFLNGMKETLEIIGH